VRYIRENACRGIKVGDVLRAVPLSRRVLESRFKRLIGRTPHEQIQSAQLESVRQLLEDTDLSQRQIAERTGFNHVEYLSVAFKRRFGMAPGVYRQRSQGRGRR
jgi:LacI family transcriptional regulator